MKIIAKRKQPIKIKDTNLEEVEEFTYLGSIVNIEGGTEADACMTALHVAIRVPDDVDELLRYSIVCH
jgi:hypothetical protein